MISFGDDHPQKLWEDEVNHTKISWINIINIDQVMTMITYGQVKRITLWYTNIAMENGPFIDGLPIKNCVFL